MGCIASKSTVITPACDNNSGSYRAHSGTLLSSLGTLSKLSNADSRDKDVEPERSTAPGKLNNPPAHSASFRLYSNLHKYIEGEQVAAGWPSWLSAVAGEAIQGWIPLKADSFEKLEKIGQGTYSSVFQARDVETGRIVALKKVRFDNFEPESVRFMAREIQILRRLNHPNVMKLEGLITSRLSSSIHLVFEYMEHDLAGLSSCPDIHFSESQVKCYMQQLLSGLDHCHSHGIMHRDIKCANLLVNDDGILKIADFGLANFTRPRNKQPLTSRVVTLWYRPPELLLGSTDYVASVDLWSVGCVFAELLMGKPLLQGRTEVEQLHKIFKLCGSPPDEYWKKSKLPRTTIFKPKHHYDSTLYEVCKSLPDSAFALLETFLAVEPYKRGTASSALKSGYFMTKPYACEPSSLPKYAPNKEIDAKSRELIHRRRAAGGRGLDVKQGVSRSHKPPQETNALSRLASRAETNRGVLNRRRTINHPQGEHKSRFVVEMQPNPENDRPNEAVRISRASQEEIPFSGPLQVSSSSGFAWAKKRREDHLSFGSHSRTSSNQMPSELGTTAVLSNPKLKQENSIPKDSTSNMSHEITKRVMMRQWTLLQRPDSFDGSEDACTSHNFSRAFCANDEMPSNRSTLGRRDLDPEKVEFSGPLLCQSHRVDELMEKHERRIRQAIRRRSWFQKVVNQGK